jgi:hypothetical protein
MLTKRTTTIQLKKLPQKTPPRKAFGIQVMDLDIHRHVAGLS